MKTPEDEEFERIEAESGWRKRQIALDQKAENAKELGLDYELESVGKLQKPTAERAWFTIAELNEWADKKLAENPNWVMPTEEPEREWVGLTDEEIQECLKGLPTQTIDVYAKRIEAKLKEKNT